MKIFRGIAYSLIALCAVLCVVILTFGGKKINDEETPLVAIDDLSSQNEEVVVEGAEIGYSELLEAASVIAKDVTDEIKEAISSTKDSVSENNTGEIDYNTIVSLQEKEYEDTFKKVISDYNKENGISGNNSSASTSTVTSKKDYKFVVNRKTKVIHKIGCILAPLEENAEYYEKIKEAKQDGYTEKCPVCSP